MGVSITLCLDFPGTQMDFRWSYEDESSVCLFRYELPSTCTSTSNPTPPIGNGSSQNVTVDSSVPDYTNCDEDDSEVDIEGISITQFDEEIKPQPFQHILTDLLHTERQTMETYLKLKDASFCNEPFLQEMKTKEEAEFSVQHSQDWQYIEYNDSFGSSYQLAVNDEALGNEQKLKLPNEMADLFAIPVEVNENSKLYNLLNNPSETAGQKLMESRGEPLNKSMTAETYVGLHETTEEVVHKSILEPEVNSETNYISSSTECDYKTMDDFQSISDESNPNPEHGCAAKPHPVDEMLADAVDALVKSNLQPVSDTKKSDVAIGPYCTAAGIFLPDLDLTILPEHRSKIPADQLKNGIVFELHANLSELKAPRKFLVKVLTTLCDLPQLNHTNPRMVDRLHRRVLMPLLAKRAELVKCSSIATSRTSSHSKWRRRKFSDPDLVSQIDSAIFVIPPEVCEPKAKAGSRVAVSSKAKERKPTLAQQLLELQDRFDTFRRIQRRHNFAFLRRISIVQHKLDRVQRDRSKRWHSERRHSMPHHST